MGLYLTALASSNPKMKNVILSIILTAILSFAVGLATPIVLDHLKTPELKLQYYVQDTLPFKTESKEMAIYQVEIKNEGTKLLESIICRINILNGEIDQASISSSDIIQYENKTEGSSFEVNAVNLNPNENIVVYILASGNSNLPAQPTVQLRADGVTGTQGELVTPAKGNSAVLTIVVGGIGIIIIIGFTAIFLIRRYTE